MTPPTHARPRFDRYVAVDWSASSRPARGRDSIWIAELDRTAASASTANPTTRAAAIEDLARLLGRPGPAAGTTIVGVDFSLGYPEGTADRLGVDGWRGIWAALSALVVDRDDNSNNRFDVAAELNRRLGGGPSPFWGCPPAQARDSLTSTKPSTSPLPPWRRTEAALRAAGHHPFSCWQLLGAGSVGSQSLLGIPRLAELRRRLEAAGVRVAVWPFEWRLDDREHGAPDVVVAEVWPTLVMAGSHGSGPDRVAAVRDERQVVAVVDTLREQDRVGDLASRLDESALDPVVLDEEGWILGTPRS